MTAASRNVAPEGVQTGGAEPSGPESPGRGARAGKPEAAESRPGPGCGAPGPEPRATRSREARGRAAARPRRAPAGAERQRDADRSRRALLDAALEEFSLRGFAGARVADIARRAGVNKQLINYYFGSKEGLYLALQRAWLEREEQLRTARGPPA